MAGQSYTIRWGAPASMETFDILYSLEGGLNWKKQEIKTTGNSNVWTLPVPPGSANKKKCLVRVIGYWVPDVRAGSPPFRAGASLLACVTPCSRRPVQQITARW